MPSLLTGWVHVGDEIEVDGNVDNAHSLAAYLQGLRNIGSVREISLAGPAVAAELAAARGVVRAMQRLRRATAIGYAIRPRGAESGVLVLG